MSASAATLRQRFNALTSDQQTKIRTLNQQRRDKILALIEARVQSVKGKTADSSAMAAARSGLRQDIKALNASYRAQALQIAGQK
jgi:hypothetical protein